MASGASSSPADRRSSARRASARPRPPAAALLAALLAAPLAVLLAAPAAPAAAEPAFFLQIDDLPVAEGLAEVRGGGVAFDGAYGSIVTACARGRAEAAAVRGFYAKVLPALGWRERRGGYDRDGERLTMTVEGGDGTVTACFRLAVGAR